MRATGYGLRALGEFGALSCPNAGIASIEPALSPTRRRVTTHIVPAFAWLSRSGVHYSTRAVGGAPATGGLLPAEEANESEQREKQPMHATAFGAAVGGGFGLIL